ncbi:rCG47189 [Rattus norvegicus]|uniref:RCG47189 n=1 Tax=Rattus norvegicus TaxID=10116 RepID=A6HZI2_RAT|nr:rCG47189 [Rattus norvegicus]
MASAGSVLDHSSEEPSKLTLEASGPSPSHLAPHRSCHLTATTSTIHTGSPWNPVPQTQSHMWMVGSLTTFLLPWSRRSLNLTLPLSELG